MNDSEPVIDYTPAILSLNEGDEFMLTLKDLAFQRRIEYVARKGVGKLIDFIAVDGLNTQGDPALAVGSRLPDGTLDVDRPYVIQRQLFIAEVNKRAYSLGMLLNVETE